MPIGEVVQSHTDHAWDAYDRVQADIQGTPDIEYLAAPLLTIYAAKAVGWSALNRLVNGKEG